MSAPRWVAPPTWPPPPPGFVPPPGWRPDPSWPVPPYGWEFWQRDPDVTEDLGDRPGTWVRWSLISFVVVIGLIVLLNGVALLLHPPFLVEAALSVAAELATIGVLLAAARATCGGWRAFARRLGLGWPRGRDWLMWLLGLGLQIGSGIVFGLVVGVLIHLLDPSFDARSASNTVGLIGAPRAAIALFAVPAVLLAPVVEECQFRGLLLRTGRRWVSFPLAALGSSLLFGLLHGPQVHTLLGATVLVLRLATFGVMQCVLVRHSRRLTPAVMVHATSNALAVALLFAVSSV